MVRALARQSKFLSNLARGRRFVGTYSRNDIIVRVPRCELAVLVPLLVFSHSKR